MKLDGKVAVITGAGSGVGRDDARNITGILLPVDGGYTAR
jgi:NADP-dependent 3-hydroxy acid dehydrogenase YdfG